MPYATIALVTDYDAGVDGHAPVTMDEVFAVMRRNVATGARRAGRGDRDTPPDHLVGSRRCPGSRSVSSPWPLRSSYTPALLVVLWAARPLTDTVPVGMDWTPTLQQPPATQRLVSQEVECNTLFDSSARDDEPLPTLTPQPEGRAALDYQRETVQRRATRRPDPAGPRHRRDRRGGCRVGAAVAAAASTGLDAGRRLTRAATSWAPATTHRCTSPTTAGTQEPDQRSRWEWSGGTRGRPAARQACTPPTRSATSVNPSRTRFAAASDEL
jgi:hypothetical protein